MTNAMLHLSDDNVLALMIAAIIMGIYGSVVLLSLATNLSYEPSGQKVDKIMISTFNIAISVISICVIVYFLV